MPSYKLHYFDARGRAETARWILAEAEQKYEDRRFPRQDWAKYKQESPTGKAPWLEVNGVKIADSIAIARLLAKKLGLAGADDLTQAKADMVVAWTEDMNTCVNEFFWASDPDRKAELFSAAVAEKLPAFLTTLEKLLSTNNGGSGFYAGTKLTWCDLHVAVSLASMTEKTGNSALLDSVPKVKAHKQRIEALPKIAAWVSKRPKTQF